MYVCVYAGTRQSSVEPNSNGRAGSGEQGAGSGERGASEGSARETEQRAEER